MIIPTFPPTFVTSLPLINTATSSSPVTNQNTKIAADNLRLAESLFKSNTVHRYPSTYFICSNCHRTVKCCDVSVQTTLHDHGTTSRIHVVTLTASDDELNRDTPWISLEPHHEHMILQEYQMGYLGRPSQDAGLASNSIPQMHHVSKYSVFLITFFSFSFP
jgi:hypothetical protein